MQTVTSADGTRIAFEEHGAGAPLILLHGGSAPQYWKPVIPHFADDYRVIVPHRRGTGESDDSDEYSLDRGVADVQAVIRALDEPPALFGHSFGGLLALETARTASIDQLIAYEPAVLVDEYREQASLAARMQEQLDAGDRQQAMKFYIREVIHGGEHDNLDAWLAEWPPWPDIIALTENIIRINRAIEEYRLPETLDIDVPTLLLAGSDGPSHLHDGIAAVNRALPTAQLTEFGQIGHGGPSEAPNRICSEVQDFLEEATVTAP